MGKDNSMTYFVYLQTNKRDEMTNINKIQAFDNLDGDNGALKGLVSPKTVFTSKHLDIICTRGCFTYIASGQQYTCPAGAFTMIVKDTFFRFVSFSDDCRIAIMTTGTSSLHMSATPRYNLVIFQHYFKENPNVMLSEEEMELVLSIYRIVKSVSLSGSQMYSEEICQAQHAALFYLLVAKVQLIQDNGGIAHIRQKSIYRTFIANVSEHFRQNRKLDFYAQLQCITPKYLSHAVKKESGVSAHELIADYVMIEAKSLLANHDLSIQEISDMLNFPNQSFFGKYFKSHEGISPLQYRLRCIA